MADPIVAVAKAIYTQLNENVTSAPVYDFAPAEESYPYILMDRHVLTKFDYLDDLKERVSSYIFVYSDYRGQKEVLEIMSEIYDALHRKQLSMDTGRMVTIQVESRSTVRDVDELTFTGRVQVSSIVEH